MQSRAARLILLCLFLAAITTAIYLFWRGDAEATAAALDARTFDTSARTAERAMLDVRAAQLAYASAGQPGDRWIPKVAQGLEGVRARVQALRADATSPTAQAALDAAGVAINELAKVDKRAIEYVRTEQRLLASDVVFGDGVERSDTALAALELARSDELRAREAAAGLFKSRGVFALTAGVAAAILAVLLLLPTGSKAAATLQVARPAEPHRLERGAREATFEHAPVSLPQDARPPEPVIAHLTTPAPPADQPSVASTAEAEEVPALVTALEPSRTTDFAGVASLCVDLARVVDTRALPALLDRTAELLDASGIVLWIADPDGRELNPIFAQGYPQHLVDRLGTISSDAQNATAAAFRTSLLQTVMADEISGGAIAAPLVTPGGCVGVMAAEVRHDSERHEATLAAATIVAAQLATLVGPPSARPQARTAGA